MGEDELCSCQYRKDDVGNKYFKFELIHKCSTKSTIYRWERCEHCGELRLIKKKR